MFVRQFKSPLIYLLLVAVDGPELERMSDEALESRLDDLAVFARVDPAQKLRIVEAYQARSGVVAMTGDGVAKEAAKIVEAVEEGRLIYRNIKKLILYLFSTSASEILVLLIALLAGYPPPLASQNGCHGSGDRALDPGLFHTVPIPLSEALKIAGVSSLVLWVEELRKMFARRRMR